MIGLPFPNAHSAEWRARVQHIENVAYENFPGISASSAASATTLEMQRKAHAKTAGREFYENACMRAVNQSIGRAIRHREDYAAIILLDQRYASHKIQRKLPGWIQSGVVQIDVAKGEGRFVDVMKNCGAFFRGKKQ